MAYVRYEPNALAHTSRCVLIRFVHIQVIRPFNIDNSNDGTKITSQSNKSPVQKSFLSECLISLSACCVSTNHEVITGTMFSKRLKICLILTQD